MAGAAQVRFGVDELVRRRLGELRGARVGMVTNDAARTSADSRVLSRVALKEAGLGTVRLFGPEHGIGASAADGEKVADARDAVTGLPVTSLYGATQRPTREMLADLDAVVFDIPDVGARFYTYIWTLSHVLEACAEAGKPLWVLDRPNPLGGELAAAEGPMLEESAVSTFVGRWSMPIRHSLTVGELARHWNEERRIGAEVNVVECAGWRREMLWPETGLEFVPPSPNMRQWEAAMVYPGTCLIEGTNLSEGRGTEMPFRLIGAPWIDGERLAEDLGRRGLKGIEAKAVRFRPENRKFGGEECGGVRLDVTDAEAARPVHVGLQLIASVIQLWPGKLEWMPYPTAANPRGGGHFERLIGRSGVMEELERQPADLGRKIEEWVKPAGWAERVRGALLYQ